MKIEIKVPSMGESISEATVGQILKQTGSLVSMDDEILELETDKVNQVLYAPQSGKIELQVESEDVVKIGQVIGYIDTEKKEEKPVESKKAGSQKEEQPFQKKISEDKRPRYSKEEYVKEIKNPKEKELKLPEEHHEESKGKALTNLEIPLEVTRKKMSRLRQVLAKRLVEVRKETAMLTTFNEVDMSQVIEFRKKYQEDFVKDHGVKLGMMSFFIKATISALKAYPEINAYIDGTDIVYLNTYNISIAVSTDKGLVVPVIRGCERRSFANIEKEVNHLAIKARNGGLTVDDMQGGGFTITNGGIYGSLLSTPILNPPQSGILGMHAIQKRAVVIDDQIVIKPMMYIALSYDHRIVDGKEAVSFLVHIKNIIEDPSRLLFDIS